MAVSAFLDDIASTTGQRRSPRRTLRLDSMLRGAGSPASPILIHNISADGLLIECDLPLERDESIDVALPHAGACLARVVWASGRLFGCRFAEPVSQATLSATTLRSAVDRPVEVAGAPEGDAGEGLGARLQRLRSLRGLTQSQLAERAGVSEAAVCAWEKGKSHPRPNRIERLAEILAVSKLELLNTDAASSVADVVRQSRERIAAAVGIASDRVRIAIEL